MNMDPACTTLSEVTRSVRVLKIDGCLSYGCLYRPSQHNIYIPSRWEIDGCEWEIRFYPTQIRGDSNDDMAMELVFLRGYNKVTANLSCRLVDPSGVRKPSAEKSSLSKSFQHPSDSSGKFLVTTRYYAYRRGYLKNGSVTLECTVTMVKDPEATPVPASDLQKDLGKLLRREAGADVTFLVSGESIPAHKNILAARSPVFMAEFFGEMKEKSSRCIEIKEIEAAVFKAMLGFIYTDIVPELDGNQASATAMAHHLLVAADRYGLKRLKVMSEARLALGIDVGTVATTLALAEQHGCSQLKAKCIEFNVGASPETLGAVLATEGFKSLEANNPSVLTELFKAAHAGRIKK